MIFIIVPLKRSGSIIESLGKRLFVHIRDENWVRARRERFAELVHALVRIGRSALGR